MQILSSGPNKIYILLSLSIVVLSNKSHEKYVRVGEKGQPRGYASNLVFIPKINSIIAVCIDKNCSSSIRGLCCSLHGMIFIIHSMTFSHLLCYTTLIPSQNKGQVLQNQKILFFPYSSFTEVYICPVKQGNTLPLCCAHTDHPMTEFFFSNHRTKHSL